MNKIAIKDADRTRFPNLALMKLSAYHKNKQDDVCFYAPYDVKDYDKIYESKVFTYTKTSKISGPKVEIGGSGHDLNKKLPDNIEHIMPDYAIYDLNYGMGFLTRGCSKQCPWCIVPKKEGNIRANASFEEFVNGNELVLMDNNVLAHKHGIREIEHLTKTDIKIDFNQGLDASLIDASIAKLLAKAKWLSPIRLSCDTEKQRSVILKAVTLLRWHNATPRKYFIYVLVQDIQEAIETIKFLKGLNCDPFAQPYRDLENKIEPTQEQKKFARWVNHKAIFNSVLWQNYQKRIL